MARWLLPGLLACGGMAVAVEDPLAQGFADPPAATKPNLYWYWLNNHVSATGITRDLETMRNLGIGAAYIGHVADRLPYGDVKLLSPAWWDLVAHAVKEGGRLGVDIGMFNCPGWSQSGGPWMAPEQSMRHLVAQEVRVQGPAHHRGVIPKAEGALQEVALLAFPAPAHDRERLVPVRVEVASGAEDWRTLATAAPATPLRIPAALRKGFAVELTYGEPVTVQALVIALTAAKSRFDCRISAGSEGVWRVVRSCPVDRSNRNTAIGPLTGAEAVLAIPPTTATAWRIELSDLPAAGEPIAGLHLTGAGRVDQAVEKQLGAMHPTPTPPWDWYRWARPGEPDPRTTVDPGAVIDLSGRLAADGTLDWDVPAGDWIISRVGLRPTGAKNGPTAPEASGPECDKMSIPAVEAMFDGMLGEFIRRIPAADRTAFRYAILDSYEVGSQNWTDGLETLFRRTYGYDPRPWLPCLAGRVVGSAERSDRFLWDLRRLVADEVGRSYVGGLRAVANRYGLRTWLENYGHWGFPGEFMKYGAHSDEIAGEFWWQGKLGNIECRAAAATAHAYGFPRVSAESYTDKSGFDRHPALLKARGDWSYCEGINHVVLHVYVHQPYEAAPGLTPWFGQHFNRLNPWFARHGKTWIDYQRRCCFLLQQGVPVADVTYFIGEDAPVMTGSLVPEPAPGNDFDFINGELVRDRLQWREGRWILPGGAAYRLLVLPPLDTMRPEILGRIEALVQAGGAILGPPPTASPSLAGWPACDGEVRRLARILWGEGPLGSSGARTVGRGRVFWGHDIARALELLGDGPDVDTGTPQLRWKHRRTEDADLYFLSNQGGEPLVAEPSFRIADRQPEVWDAVRGTRVITRRFTSAGGRTRVPIALEPSGSCFVIFRGRPGPAIARVQRDGVPASPADVSLRADGEGTTALLRESGAWRFTDAAGAEITREVPALPPALPVAGPWQVEFEADRGAPRAVQLDRLIPLAEHPEAGVRHFSGSAVWHGAFDLPAARRNRDERLELDLGKVGVIAVVRLNGTDLGTLWQPPFRLDITDAVREGRNTLEVTVTTTWVNRLIGDAALPDDTGGGTTFPDWVKAGTPRPEPRRIAFACQNPVRPGTPLEPSGLIGPVEVRSLAVRSLR